MNAAGPRSVAPVAGEASPAFAPVAIVGMACRLPGGATSPERLWGLLRDGTDAVGEIPPERFDVDALFDPDPAAPGRMHVRRGGFLEGIDRFDAGFFGISPREARRMDPQQRLLLELTWEALEDGGQPPDRLAGRPVGVFVGVSSHDYGDLAGQPSARRHVDAYTAPGGALSIAANRISHQLDLRGPSLAVDTACSSGLTAVHLACASLAAGECELAVAGAANVLLSPDVTISFSKAGMLAPDGRCKPFDADADGYVRSEGAGAVVLKPLERALADGDPVRAVLLATALNQDGRTTGISLPSAAAQEDLIRRALAAAGLAPDAIDYVQAHGTGTAAGDPVEATAIGRALGAGRPADRQCPIGSIKGNLGHVEAAAGMAGLIATALALGRRSIPPTINLRRPSPRIPWADLGLRVPTELEPWPAARRRPRAGVNSFGFGGANAHAILEGPPAGAAPGGDEGSGQRLVPISARDPRALRALAADWASMLRADDAPALRDLCHTAARRRAHHPHRIGAVAASRTELADHLDAYTAGEPPAAVATGTAPARAPRVAFVFPGMGPQWWGMCRGLADEEPLVRATLVECDRLARPVAGWSLLDALGADEAGSRVAEPRVAHLANLAVQVALTRLWARWGVVPDAVVGHSSGEAAAAVAAGALSLEDAIIVTVHRGRLQHRTAGSGGMLALDLAPDAAVQAVAGDPAVALAAVNSPASVTLSGDLGGLERIAARMREAGRLPRWLPVDVPYHGPQMDPLRDELLEALAGLAPRPPALTLVSTVTGADLDGVPMDAAYWWRNVRRPVRFADAIARLAADDRPIVVEVGPHPVLAGAVSQCLAASGGDAPVLASLRRGEDERRAMLRSLAALYAHGVPVDWDAVAGPGRAVSLPAYPWQRERHWVEPPEDDRPAGTDVRCPLLGRRLRAARPRWEADLADARLAYLEGHTVRGVIAFPGAGFVEVALSAAREARPEGPVALERVELRRMLTMVRRDDHLLQCALDEDGSIEVHSARRAPQPDWTLHARARLEPDAPAPPPAVDLAAARRRCPAALDPETAYRRAGRRGVGYGGPFLALTEARLGAGEAVARVRSPEGTVPGAYAVHPALLDAALQTLALALDTPGPNPPPEGPIVPVAIDRVELHRPPEGELWAHATLVPGPVGEWTGDVHLCEGAGDVLVRCAGVRLQPLEPRRPGSVDGLLYRDGWEPAPEEPDGGARPRPAEVAEAVEPSLRRACAERLRDYDEVVEPALNALAGRYARRALAELGPSPDLPAGRRRLLERVRALARAPDAAGAEPLDAAADRLGEAYPGHRAVVELVRESGERLAGSLRGDEDAREFLFADGAPWEALVATYAVASPSRVANEAVAAAAGALHRGGGHPLRVVEVGAGTGGTTGAVLERLGDAPVDYLVTDVSPLLLQRCRERLGERAGVHYMPLDIEREPAAELIGRADLVIAANVVHATPDLRATLGRLARLLAPGGLICLQELIRRSAWLDMVFAQLDGWWRFADRDLRPAHPLADLDAWGRALADAGLQEPRMLRAATEGRAAEPVQAIMLARAGRSAAVPPAGRRWLLLADRGGAAQALARELRAGADDCTLAWPGESLAWRGADTVELRPTSAGEWAAVLERARPDAVVSLWSLDAPAAGELDAAGLMAVQDVVCGGMSALTRALATRGAGIREVWVVTAGAHRASDEDGPPDVAQAPVWGLSRVLRNERPRLRCRAVDLGPERGAQDVAALARLLRRPGDDEEVALRGGRRLVRRVRAAPLERTAAPPRRATRDDAFRLEVGAPGALDSLALHPVPVAPPGAGEVAVRVRAAALNFKDVLLGLGMVSWPGGGEPLLGGECAGVVEACGEGVEHVAPGDEVIALGFGTLASRAVLRAEGVARLPRGLGMEEAATTPGAFVTAIQALRHLAGVAAGERVLVHSGAGGVGLAALQVARVAGAEVLATAGTREKRAYLRSLGVSAALDSRTPAFAAEVMRLTDGEGVDVVLNSLAGEALRRGLEILRPGGRFVELGRRDMDRDAAIGLAPFRRGLSFVSLRLPALVQHRPERLRALLDELVGDLEEGRLEPLPHTVLDLSEAEDAFRLMASGGHVGRIVLVLDEPSYPVAPRRDEAPFRSDGTYLITGGLGGLGLSLAAHLARRGVRHLVLASRRGAPRAEEEPALRALRGAGAEVLTARCDVSRPDDLARLLARVRATMPPLRGVVHAAMTLDDATLENLDAARLRAVLAPKAAGAWNLHLLTREDPIETFVLLSSIASLIGTRGQAAYAAGNAMLEALADHRLALGLPALTLGLGAVADVGHVARHAGVLHRFAGAGVEPFPAAEAWAALEELTRAGGGRRTVARMDWGDWAAGPLATLATTAFAPLIPCEPRAREAAPEDGADDLRGGLRAATPVERRAIVERHLVLRAARVLDAPAERLDPGRPITEMGIDSLMAVELMTAVQRDLRVSLSLGDLLEGASLRELAGRVLDQLPPDGAV